MCKVSVNVMRLVLYQPDIPPNTGTLIRLGSCFNVPIDVIEPCGFPWQERSFHRAGLDYLEMAEITRHTSWKLYHQYHRMQPGRLILMTTKAAHDFQSFKFRPDDSIVLGRESAGVPDECHDAADMRLRIPMAVGRRSLNVALAGAIALSEALRQTSMFPMDPAP